ncbi:iron donor protein CyaY [Sphaerotilus natans subsp. natans DSM 6575]|jgi:CyaY protein|uniref:Iron-sulfur cluster assembly protein CyaY n=1 Tax=Sphaerotilus natans subsp. natans DSM 6575 TaxID=1286631 RepID=A0A059KMG7_9BURK|nr:iron donor protein CyaY [Sphaerotilus natans]KDB52520.1 iron donor protein CyaY [Sphaerotilus natans subsp. natans DSM 6575]SIR85314.1 CyaY protein [Sphaerotilus natans]
MTPPDTSDRSTPSGLADAEYLRLAHAALAAIETTIDRWLDEDLIDIDTHRTGGLLELSFPGGSKIILNTQPPLHEIWMAARAGGYHYRWVDGAWRDTRSGEEFFAALSAQASAQGGRALRFEAPAA